MGLVAALFVACGSHGPPPERPAAAAPTTAPLPLPPRRRPGAELANVVSNGRNAERGKWLAESARIALSDDPAAADVLVTYLAGARAADVASVLPLLGGDAARETLGVAIDHADPEVVVRAGKGLAASDDPRAAPIVAAALQRGESGCAEILAAARGAGAGRVLDAAALSPTPCGVGARDLAFASLRAGDAAGALPLLTAEVLAEGPLGATDAAALAALPGDFVRARARTIVGYGADADLVALALDVLGRARDAAGLDAAANRLEGFDLSACETLLPATVAEPDVCRLVRSLVLGLARAGDARALEPARRLSTMPVEPVVFEDALVARSLLDDRTAADGIRSLFASGRTSAKRLVALDPPPPLVREMVTGPDAAVRDPECRVVLSGEDARAMEAARFCFEHEPAPSACRERAAQVLTRGRDPDETVAAFVKQRAAVLSTILTEEDADEARWLLPILGDLPIEQRVPWPTVREVYLRLAEVAPHIAMQPEVMRAVITQRPPPGDAPHPRLLDAVRAVSARPDASAAALRRMGLDDAEAGARIVEMLLPGGGASPSARVPNLDADVATARLFAGVVAAGHADLVATRLPDLAPGAADALGALAARSRLAAAPLVPLLSSTRVPGLAAALARTCDASCEAPLRTVLRGPSPWGRAAAAAVAGAAGIRALVPDLRTLAAAATEPAASEAAVALVALGAPGIGASIRSRVRANGIRAAIATLGAGDLPPEVDPSSLDCSTPGNDPLGPWLAAAYAVRRLGPALDGFPQAGKARTLALLSWGESCLLEGTALADELPYDSTDAEVRAALAPAIVSAARRQPSAALLPPLATDDDPTVRLALAEALAVGVPARERQRFVAELRLLAGDADPRVRAVVARTIEFADPKADEIATRFFGDPEVSVRRDVLANPGLAGSLANMSVLSLTGDAAGSVREAVAQRAIRGIYGRVIATRLLSDPFGRMAATRGICALGTPADLDALLSALASSTDDGRPDLVAACASARRLVADGLDPLVDAVGGRDVRRASAAVELAEILSPRDRLAVLERARRHRASPVRRAAATFAVQAVVDDEDVPGGAAFARAAFSDRDKGVRCAVIAGAGTPDLRAALANAIAPGMIPPDFDALWREWRCAER